jgi:hypothetical protein
MVFHKESVSASSRLIALRRLVASLLAGVLASVAAIAGAASPLRGDFYAQAAAREQVPLNVLVAIAGAESGYHPWALNIDGHEVYCHSREEAERLLATDDHVSIGLMQINWRYWGPRLGRTKAELLDPETNLIYGARILRDGLGRSGSIWSRISNYHSGSLQERDKYNQLVYRNYRRYLEGEPITENSRRVPRDMTQISTPSVPKGSAPSNSANGFGQPQQSTADNTLSTFFRYALVRRKAKGNVFASGGCTVVPVPRHP